MEQRRFILFITLSMAVLIGWINIGPILFPDMFPKPRQKAAQQADVAEGQAGDAAWDGEPQPGEGEPADDAANVAAREGDAEGPVLEAADLPEEAAEPPHPPEFAKFLNRDALPLIELGSLDPNSGYFQRVRISPVGAAVADIQLNDPRYKELTEPGPGLPRQQLKVVGNHVDASRIRPLERTTPELSLQTAIPEIDVQLAKLDPVATSLNINWELIDETFDPAPGLDGGKIRSGVTFRLPSPDGTFEVLKTYSLRRYDADKYTAQEARNVDPNGYKLQFDLKVRNLSPKPQIVNYVLQGPVGLPLENQDNTAKFRDVRVGYREPSGKIDSTYKSAKDIAKAAAADNLEDWRRTIQYIGVDVQYFAALLLPDHHGLPRGDLNPPGYIAAAQPTLVRQGVDLNHSDISIKLESHPLDLAAAGDEEEASATHTYTMFAGPKRQDLLASPIGADEIVDYGWFSAIAKGMVWLLNWFHSWGVAYGIAIILLTMVVRACMFPLSKKQAVGAQKMKELQPKLAELKKKYGDDKEKMARAQLELFSKNNYNPLAGCLPIFLQFPIFIGLYRALSSAVDLRMAPFLWIDNLAAPDALFSLPFNIWFLGGTFNLLPIVVIVLFIVQQKMFMPPPTDEQSALQQKMMMYMMIFFGFLFYRMPAGLCVYFIASSLWGIGERKLLDFQKDRKKESGDGGDDGESGGQDDGGGGRPGNKQKAAEPKAESFWSRLGAPDNTLRSNRDEKSNGNGRSKKKKKSRQRR
jgi:YidC/Oxa1 family membrane protein insertase